MTEKKREDQDEGNDEGSLLGTIGSTLLKPFMVPKKEGDGEEEGPRHAAKSSRPAARQTPIPSVPSRSAASVSPAMTQVIEADPEFYARFISIVQTTGETSARFLKMVEKLTQKYGDQVRAIQTTLDTFEADDSMAALKLDMAKVERTLTQEGQKADTAHAHASEQINQSLSALGTRYAGQKQQIEQEIARLTTELESKRQQLAALPNQQIQEEQSLQEDAAQTEAKFASIQAAMNLVLGMVKTVGERS